MKDNRLLAIFLIVLHTFGILTAGPTALLRTGVNDAWVRFVLAKVECDNPEEVAAIVFASQDASLFSDPNWEKRCKFSKENLGDGKMAYVFCPPWGHGQWGFRPSYHFEKKAQQLHLIFDSQGTFAEYLPERGKYNGRYLLYRRWRADFIGGITDPSVKIAWSFALYFWDGEKYRHAYSTTEIEMADDPAMLGSTFIWNEDARENFLSARVTWEHKVKYGETLGAISRQYETPMREILLQNDIQDQDKITEGLKLVYDSRKTASGLHSHAILKKTQPSP
ncbi:MAG: LysM domain-containing protein [Kiritimatiellae bacterium]|jgi:hypothetical protein|nr:LysM domain-containing protein [Kiritimatiellia bacterium]